MNAYLAVVSKTDVPLFEAEFFRPDCLAKLENDKSLHQFIVHAALDMVESVMWSSHATFLKIVDRYGDWMVSAYLSASGERFLLLHDTKNEDGIKQFFTEFHELFTKYTLNPFYEHSTPITSGSFQVKARLLGKKYLEK